MGNFKKHLSSLKEMIKQLFIMALVASFTFQVKRVALKKKAHAKSLSETEVVTAKCVCADTNTPNWRCSNPKDAKSCLIIDCEASNCGWVGAIGYTGPKCANEAAAVKVPKKTATPKMPTMPVLPTMPE